MAVKSELTAVLSASRGGQVLGARLVAIVVDYLVDVVEIAYVKEFDMKTIKETVAEAWAHAKDGASLPGHHLKCLTGWLRGQSSDLSITRSSRR